MATRCEVLATYELRQEELRAEREQLIARGVKPDDVGMSQSSAWDDAFSRRYDDLREATLCADLACAKCRPAKKKRAAARAKAAA